MRGSTENKLKFGKKFLENNQKQNKADSMTSSILHLVKIHDLKTADEFTIA